MTWDELYEFYRGISDSCYEKYPVDVQVLHDINTKRQFADGNDTLKVISQSFLNTNLKIFSALDYYHYIYLY